MTLSFDPDTVALGARHFIGRAPLAGATADPVLTLQTFETEEEALARAHHATYGFCAGDYTRDLSRALRVMHAAHRGGHHLDQPLRPVP